MWFVGQCAKALKRGIIMQLDVRYSGPEEVTGLQSYDLKVEVTNAVGVDAEIFVFQRNVPSATDPEATNLGDEFIQVADPVSLGQYPIGSPDLANDIPYYRLAQVSLRFRSMSELEDTKDLISSDITGLINALKISATLVVMEEVTYD
jgi:hypothetical protein